MLCFYFFPQDGKFGQSLTWPDHGSDSEAKYSTAQTESLTRDQAREDGSKYLLLFWKH